ncbi:MULTISPECIES: PAS domain S-box protein [unclassified Nostoc]|uniref:PAS domain S-box protein n=1 Tax=unclassified Nostoc TaxID=2593658 RepID=UPI001E0A7B2F|nr:PAS domain S-box protein [Nostoc sp. JL23]MBN3875778.1 PAS domain S-box protein [Nostoc sp. JL23]
MSHRSHLTILVIDDCAEDREIYHQYLQQDRLYTHNILEFQTAKQAMTWCQQQIPDVILLDYLLPDDNGLGFLQNLRENLNNSQSAVIMLTGQGDETIAVRAMKKGAQDYLVKNYLTPEILQSAIHHAVELMLLTRQLEQSRQQQQLMAAIALRIRQSLDLEEILTVTAAEVRQFLQTDRVVIYQFQPDMSGTIVAESILPGWTVAMGAQIQDNCFKKGAGADYHKGKKRAIDDINQAGLTPCHLQLLEQFQVKACLIVPILVTNKLWGLLIAHQCTVPRHWRSFELDLLDQLAVQIAIAIQQASTYQQAQAELQERKRVEAALRESEQRFRQMADTAPVLIWMAGLDKACQYFNKTWLEFTGKTLEAEVDDGWAQGIHPDELQDCLDTYVNAFDARENFQMEYRLKRFDGEYRWILDTGTPRFTSEGEFLGYISSCVDISDKILAERTLQQLNLELEARVEERTAALRESEERWYLALRGSNDGIWDWNIKTSQVFFSARWEEMLGFAENELIHNFEAWSSRIHLDDRDRVMKVLADHLAHKTPFFQEEYQIKCKDGSYIWILDRGQALWDEFSNAIRMSGSATDITRRKQTEAALLAVTRLKQSILASIDYAIVSTNSEGIIQTFNLAAQKMLGYTADEVIGKLTPNTFHDPEELKQRTDVLSREMGREIPFGDLSMVKIQQDSCEVEWTFIRKDGSRFPVALSVKPLCNLEGQIIGGVGIAKDITQQKQIEAQLRKNAANLASAQRIANLGSWEMDLQTQQLIWSEEVFRIFGRNPESGTPSYNEMLHCIHPDDRDRRDFVLLQAMERGQPYEIEYRFYRADGSLGYLLSQGEFILDINRQPCQLIGTILDITKRKQTEEQLRNLSDRLTLALKSANIGIWDWDMIQDAEWDDRMYELYDLQSSDTVAVYQDWVNRLHPDDLVLAETSFQEAVLGVKEFDTEFRIILSDGSIRFIKASALVQRNEQGEPQRMVGINYDITDRKQVELALRESEHRYATLTEAAPVAILRLDADSNCIYVNERWGLMMGKPTAAALGKGWLENIHLEDCDRLLMDCSDPCEQRCRLHETCRQEVRYLRPDGCITWFYMQIVPETNPSGTLIGYIGTLTDITIRKEIESEVNHHRDLREAIFNESADALFLVDSDTQLIFDCNRRAVELFEVSEKEELMNIQGNTLQRYEFTPQELDEIVQEVNHKSWWSREIEYASRKGNFFWGNLAAQQITVAGKAVNLVRLSDISERKKAVEQIQRSLEEKETLLKEIHHRVKNNLQIISSLLRMQSRRSGDETTLMLFKESQDRVQSMALIHEQLYQSADIYEINFDNYIKSLTDSLFRSYGISQKDIVPNIEMNGIKLPLDTAIPCGLIINELVSNCLKYAFPEQKKGKITISLEQSSENQLILAVKDTGVGILETLDWENNDSLGLRIVKNLVKQLKGNIFLECDRGTSFYMYFPQSS